MEDGDLEFPLSNGNDNNRRSELGHDRNLSLPSNTSSSRDLQSMPRPSRAATYSRASGYKYQNFQHQQQQHQHQQTQPQRPQPTAAESTPVVPQHRPLISPQTDKFPTGQTIYQGSAITTPSEGITIPNLPEETGTEEARSEVPTNYKSKQTDPKTPSEYALHILFTQVRFCFTTFSLIITESPD